METKLNLIAEVARKDRKCKFNNLAHLLNEENLKMCFLKLKKDKASGVDGVSFRDYEHNLEGNITDLVKRMKQWSYRPQPVRRVYIPKGNGRSRPLGIPAIEDKIVQLAVTKILQAIYEEDFLSFSYGFRPGRSCHQALNALDKMVMQKPVNHVIDADIQGFFDNVDHEWLMKCLEERVSDRNLLRLIRRLLKAGIIEDGTFIPSQKGTPQGGILSPLLANIYLHYVLDLWMDRVVKPASPAFVGIVRYADDFVICVQREQQARDLQAALAERLGKFGLKLSEEKTQVIAFGRYARENAKRKGHRPGTFSFLGLTHFCDKSRAGNFKVGRKTERGRLAAGVRDINQWLRRIRNMLPVEVWWPVLCAKMRGHFQYYGVSGNFRALRRYQFMVVRAVFKWMNRRSQKRSFYWRQFHEYLKRHPLPDPKIHHNLYTLYGY